MRVVLGREPSVTAAQAERKLADEGLAPLDDPATGRRIWKRGVSRWQPEAAEVREAYLSWARALLSTRRPFRRGRAGGRAQLLERRMVWRLHAEGKSNAEVARQLAVTRAAVERVLRVVVSQVGPPPVVNPWRRSKRDQAWAAIEQHRRTRMADGQKNGTPGPRWMRYAIIRLRSNETVKVPGQRERSELIDVEGRPTALGIDVKFPDTGYETLAARLVPVKGIDLIISVPAYKISQAEICVPGAGNA